MDFVKLKLGQAEFDLPRQCITVTDVTTLFHLERNGLHLKIQRDSGEWSNQYPSLDGSFDTGTGSVCYVVSLAFNKFIIYRFCDNDIYGS